MSREQLERQVEELRDQLEKQKKQAFYLSSIVRHAPVALVLLDSSLGIQAANLAATKLLGVDTQSSEPLTYYIHIDDQDLIFDLCDQALQKNANPVEVHSIDGTNTFLAHAIHHKGSTTITLTDITTRVQQEKKRRLKDYEESSLEKLNALGLLSGGVAHDINNVMGAISALTGCILDELPPDSHQREDLLHIQEATMRGRNFTSSLQAIAKHPATTTSDLQSIDQTLNELVKLIERTTNRKVRIKQQLGASAAQVMIKRRALAQMLYGILNNAFKLAEQHVLVTSRLEHNNNKEYVVITISDDGKGLQQNNFGRTSEPYFFSQNNKGNDNLSLTSAIATANSIGGQISIDTASTQGTNIRVVLPTLSGAQPNPSNNTMLNNGAHILVIDDHALINRATCQVLNRQSYQTLSALDGEQGVDLMKQHKDQVQLAIVDMMMPGLDGIDTIKQLRMVNPSLPIILCTGHLGVREEEARALKIPILTKPWLKKELLNSVLQLFQEKNG